MPGRFALGAIASRVSPQRARRLTLPASTGAQRLRRGPLLAISALASVGAALIYLPPVTTVWLMSWPYAMLFAVLGVAQLGLGVWVLVRPTRRGALLAVTTAVGVVAFWALIRLFRLMSDPDPWLPVNSVIGFTDDLCVVVETVAALGFSIVALRRPREAGSPVRRVLTFAALAPVVVVVSVFTLVGVIASTDGLAGAGFPARAIEPRNLPAGQMSTVEYCRPNGVPLAMDLYMPAADVRSRAAAPVAMYVHGGGPWGDRKTYGAGASLANHAGALFGPIRDQLNRRGFVVAAIDYRLPPGTPWPAQIEDVKCAVRFLRAHAADLGIDPAKIGVWGSSGGAVLSALLGLAGPDAGFDVGQYLDQSSDVQAVVDMFGPANLNDLGDVGPFFRFVLKATFGDSSDVRRAASPMTYVAPGAPPFLILQGTDDPLNRTHQSAAFLQALKAAGVSAELVEVAGAGHTLNAPGEQPSANELTASVVDFFSVSLG